MAAFDSKRTPFTTGAGCFDAGRVGGTISAVSANVTFLCDFPFKGDCKREGISTQHSAGLYFVRVPGSRGDLSIPPILTSLALSSIFLPSTVEPKPAYKYDILMMRAWELLMALTFRDMHSWGAMECWAMRFLEGSFVP